MESQSENDTVLENCSPMFRKIDKKMKIFWKWLNNPYNKGARIILQNFYFYL